VYPRLRSLIFAGACASVAAVALAGCGGGGGSATGGPPQTVREAGFSFRAPGKWHVSRTQGQVSASPKPIAPELVSVSVFPLQRAYTPDLYALEVQKELDPYSRQLAAQQKGYVRKKSDTTVAGEKARQYEIFYTRNGEDLNEQITFLFRGKTEYELLCQWQAKKPSEPDYCVQLRTTFKPT
jgi:arylsulfatase A-like enzyme